MTVNPPDIEPVPVGSVFRGGVQNLSPPWLANINGYKFTYSTIGIPLDAQAEYLRIGERQRFPGVCQSDALQYIGRDRKILRGYRESDAAYSNRLIGAFPTWRLAGNAPTLLAQLAAYFSPTPPIIRYVVNGIDHLGNPFTDWWTMASGVLSHYRYQNLASPFGPTNWNWDNQTGQIRFWIIIYRNQGFTPWFWGDGHVWGVQPDGSHLSWGFREDFTQNFAADAHRLIGQWKAAGSHAQQLGGIIVTGDMTLFNPTGDSLLYPHGTWDNYASRAGVHAAAPTFYLDGI